jgi:site-specific DNA-methyltransferase (adenine-specific)
MWGDHPTVKPIALMRYLCRITRTPAGGIVLDPFCGTGTTLFAAREEGRKFIGIDNDEKSVAEARKRCAQETLF